MTQVILSLGSVDLAEAQRDRQGPAVGGDARVHLGDQLRQDRHADDEPDDGGRGASTPPTATRSRASATGSRARSTTPPAAPTTIEDAILPYLVANDAKLVDGKVVGDPDRGRAARARPQGRPRHRRAPASELPRLATLPFDPDLQADGDLQLGHRRGRASRSCGASSRARRRRSWTRAATALSAGGAVPWDAELSAARRRAHGADGGRGLAGDGRGHPRPRPGRRSTRRRPARATSPTCEMTSLVGMVDPPREESKAAVGRRPGRAHPGPDGDRRRRHHRCGDRRAARDPRRGDARRRLRRAVRGTSGSRASTTSASSAASRPSTRCCSPTR